jgi:hypothetical protein
MRILTSPLFVLTASFMAFTGCLAGTEENPDPGEDVGEAHLEAGGGLSGPGGNNHIRPSCTWSHYTLEAYRHYAQHSLASAPTISNITPGCRREVLENMIQCALAPEQVWLDPYEARPTPYAGWWGLAPGWLNSPLDPDGRRWVTACMAQRLNYFGKSVDILLEGMAPPINVDTVLDPQYPFDESRAWGDFFSTPPTSAFEIYVCYDPDLATLCGGTSGMSPITYLDYRVCDNVQGWYEPDGTYSPCGLHVMGPCNNTSVCFNNSLFSPYKTCYRPDGTTDNHTIHVQLEPKTVCSL